MPANGIKCEEWVCPKCGSDRPLTIDTRTKPDQMIRRRKQCRKCGQRWNTLEAPEYMMITSLRSRKYKDPR